jgi:hypothetical protein
LSLRPIIAVAVLILVAGVGVSQVAKTLAAPPAVDQVGADRTRLNVPHLRQERLLCVPTSAAMIMAYYGDPQSPRRLKTLTLGRQYDPGAPFQDFSVTPFRDLVRAVGSLGYGWSQETYPDTREGYAQGLARIEGEVRAGRPVMADVSLGAVTHTVVIAGFDARRRELYVVDPDMVGPGRRTVGYDQFESLWNEHALQGRFRAIVLTRRKLA